MGQDSLSSLNSKISDPFTLMINRGQNPHLAGVSTLVTSMSYSPDQCVDLGDINVIQLLDGLFDLWFVCPFVHNEHQSVVVFDLLHGRLCS